MVSVKCSLVFWGLLLLLAHFHSGHSLFLGYKKDLLKHKLYKVKEALLSAHDSFDEVHHHYHYKPIYKPLYVAPSYKLSSSYASYGWPSYSGWHY